MGTEATTREVGIKSNAAGGGRFVRCSDKTCGYGYWVDMWSRKDERECPYCGHTEPLRAS